MRAPPWFALLAFLATGAAAQEPAAEQRALLDLYVNELKQETSLVYLPEGGDALVPVAELVKAGMHGFGGRREMHDGLEYVSLASLKPLVTSELDLDRLLVRVTAHPSLLGAATLDLRPSGRPAEMVLRSDAGGFLNYSVTGAAGAGMTGAAELGATFQNALLYTGLSLDAYRQVVRGLSNLVYDQPSAMRRITVGDAYVPGGGLGGSLLLGGVSVVREFSLDPYFVRTPMPRLQGAVLTPSTLDVYVNGTLVRSIPVLPGTFEARNVPVNNGAGSYSYVLRDAFGRTQEFSAPYYASPGLLSQGLTEYSYSLGVRRNAFGLSSFDYGTAALSAMHRLGLTDHLTAGARFEAGLQCVQCGGPLASGGASLVAGLPFGEVSTELALSTDGGSAGAAATLAYSLTTPLFSTGVSARGMSATYANLGLPAAADRAVLGVHGFAGAQLGPVLATSVDYDLSSMRDTGLTSRLGLRLDTRLGAQATLSAGLSRIREAGTPASFVGTVALLYSFGSRTLGHAGSSARDSGVGAEAGLQRSIPIGEGIGYQVRTAMDPDGTGSGTGFLQAQGAHGIVSGTYNRFGRSDGGSATVAGSLVAVGGDLFTSRPVQQGYALMQVPGVGGVRGFLNDQEIGRTDGSGNLLVPEMQPYYANRLSLAPDDLPLDYVVGKPHEQVATTFRGGAVVRFEAHRIQAVSGTVKVREAVPAYGELTVSGAGDFVQSSPIGAQGQFFLERMRPGSYHAAVEYAAGSCSFDLDVPKADAAQIDVGALVCTRLRPATATAQQ